MHNIAIILKRSQYIFYSTFGVAFGKCAKLLENLKQYQTKSKTFLSLAISNVELNFNFNFNFD